MHGRTLDSGKPPAIADKVNTGEGFSYTYKFSMYPKYRICRERPDWFELFTEFGGLYFLYRGLDVRPE